MENLKSKRTKLADTIAALKAFGVAYRSEGESSPNTARLWRAAIQAQADYREARDAG